jgi:hypothetical protein
LGLTGAAESDVDKRTTGRQRTTIRQARRLNGAHDFSFVRGLAFGLIEIMYSCVYMRDWLACAVHGCPIFSHQNLER